MEPATDIEASVHCPATGDRGIAGRTVVGQLDGKSEAMRRWGAILMCLAGSFLPEIARAHVGSPNVFFEGMAGPYPVHVIVQPAEVIPGLAQISARVEGGGVERVTALPIK